MVGKGRRRREKNYRAAHGGPARLPPPPDPSQIEALPSKLRQLISFTSASLQGSMKIPKEAEEKRKRLGADAEKRRNTDREIKLEARDLKDDGDNAVSVPSQQSDSEVEIEQISKNEKRKKKRKRKQVTDLRFQEEMLGIGSKRRERKKKYFEAKKKKHKKAKTEENIDFPGREHVKFGEVVEAPPKLVVPKAFKIKTAHDASKERLRLQAIEAYRNRKGWTSRPGAVELPPPMT